MALTFGSDDLIDGSFDGWPASIVPTNFPGQGWQLHAAPYSSDDGEESPESIRRKCDAINDLGLLHSKAAARKAIESSGFKADE